MSLRSVSTLGRGIGKSAVRVPTTPTPSLARAHTRAFTLSLGARYASVPDNDAANDLLSKVASGSSSSPSERNGVQSRRAQAASPQSRTSASADAKERKMRQYEKLLQARAAEEGVDSIEALVAKKKAERGDSSLAATNKVEKEDLELAARIRELAEKETRRKLESGELGSGGGGGGETSSGIKPLSKIIDVEKLAGESTEKIKEVWTQYHTLKGKLSAVIPADTYGRLVDKARRYPQFVLPLPREVVGGEEAPGETSDLAPGQKKQGYEMQFMEWGFLAGKNTPSTVLFTPLAEYKLRGEFAQPLLVLTHYTDLVESKGVVLMRGEITSSEEIAANPAAVAAAENARAQGASEEEQQRLKDSPVQSSLSGGKAGKMGEQDAQLLAMTMQRFYLPDVSSEAGKEREQLLSSFHAEPEAFSVERLCEAAFAL